ncbi:MAG: thiol:disulfide interchange protein DsbA/DsbL [Betaproteobacteria bacterium]|nr:thiol:disulfide interchange protein DsbA/DsbL [Betaproteobacteria bacterium]
MFLRQALALAATLLTLAFSGHAQQGPWQLVNPPQPQENNGKIEVIEFFWYGCPHCYAIESDVNAWLAKKPADVDFKRVPAPMGGWLEGAKIYYTLEAMGLLAQYHDKVFDAIHKDNVNLFNAKKREEWLAKNGIDPEKYAAAEKSFSVDSRLKRAMQLVQTYKVDGVPRFVVAGKWYTGAEWAGGEHKIMPAVDQLIDMARHEMPAAGKSAAAPAAVPAKK